jgi:hypothetical protein
MDLLLLHSPEVERNFGTRRIAEICPDPQFGLCAWIRVGGMIRPDAAEPCPDHKYSQWYLRNSMSWIVCSRNNSLKKYRTNTILRKIPTALADHVEKNNLQGQLKYNLFVGASSGAETENRWARLNMIERRSPHQVGKEIAKGINNGNIKFFDKHLSMFPVDLMYG